MTAKSKRAQFSLNMVDLTADENVPPERYLLFPWGDYVTYEIDSSGMPQYETYTVDERSAASIVDAFNRIGNDIMIDYEHGNEMATGPDDGGRAAGWIKGIEVVEGEGIYADPVTWTPRATQLLRDREYRYRSPHFTYDPKTMRVVALLDDSLVNKPASVGMIPMAAKATDAPASGGGDNTNASTKGRTMSDAILKALSVQDEGEAVAAVATMKADAERMTAEIESAKSAAKKATDALEVSDALISSIMEIEECESRDALIGACKAHRDDAAKVAEMSSKLEEIEQAAIAAEKATLIDGASVSEDTRTFLEGQTIEVVREYVEKCCKTPQVNTGEPQSKQAKSTPDTAPEPWFRELNFGKSDEEIAAEWKAHCAWKKAHPVKYTDDVATDE